MRVRNLKTYLTDNDLLKRDGLESLEGLRLGIDAAYWMRSLPFTKDPLTEPTVGIPTTLYPVLAIELRRFREHNITPVFVFHGLEPPSHRMFTAQSCHEVDVAWSTLAQSNYSTTSAGRPAKQSVGHTFANTGSRINSDLVWCVLHYLKSQGIDTFQAPYFASAQLAYFTKTRIVEAVLGHPGMLLFGFSKVIAVMNFSEKYILWADQQFILDRWKITEAQFVHCCLLAGTEYCMTHPSLEMIVRYYGGPFKFMLAVDAINQGGIADWTATLHVKYENNVNLRVKTTEAYSTCSALIRHPLVMLRDGVVGPLCRNDHLIETMLEQGAGSKLTGNVPGVPKDALDVVGVHRKAVTTTDGTTAEGDENSSQVRCVDETVTSHKLPVSPKSNSTGKAAKTGTLPARTVEKSPVTGTTGSTGTVTSDGSKGPSDTRPVSAGGAAGQGSTATSCDVRGGASQADGGTARGALGGGAHTATTTTTSAMDCSSEELEVALYRASFMAAKSMPCDFTRIVGAMLTFPVYLLMSEGFLSRKIPSALALAEWLDCSHPPVDTIEFRELLKSIIVTTRVRALGLVAAHLPPTLQTRPIKFLRYNCVFALYQPPNHYVGEAVPAIHPGLSVTFNAKDVAVEMNRQGATRVDSSFCLHWYEHLEAAGRSLLTATKHGPRQSGISDLNSMTASVILLLLDSLGYFTPDGGPTAFFRVLRPTPPEFQYDSLFVLELMRHGALSAEPYEGPPDRPLCDKMRIFRRSTHSVEVQHSILLISRVFSLLPMQLDECGFWESEVDYDLAAFHSMGKALRRCLRQLTEACLSNVLLQDLKLLEILPKNAYNPKDPILPFFLLSRNCLGVVAKFMLEFDPSLDVMSDGHSESITREVTPYASQHVSQHVSHAVSQNPSIGTTADFYSALPEEADNYRNPSTGAGTTNTASRTTTSDDTVNNPSRGTGTGTGGTSTDALPASTGAGGCTDGQSPKSQDKPRSSITVQSCGIPSDAAAGGSDAAEVPLSAAATHADVKTATGDAATKGAAVVDATGTTAATHKPNSATAAVTNCGPTTAATTAGSATTTGGASTVLRGGTTGTQSKPTGSSRSAVQDNNTGTGAGTGKESVMSMFEKELAERYQLSIAPISDLVRGVRFWNNIMRIVISLDKLLKEMPVYDQFVAADKFLKGRIAYLNLTAHPEWILQHTQAESSSNSAWPILTPPHLSETCRGPVQDMAHPAGALCGDQSKDMAARVRGGTAAA